jgi:pseudouridine-5'-phosphate glycosidase
VSGKRLTPYLLARLARVTGGAAVVANRALAKHNAEVGAALAVELSRP